MNNVPILRQPSSFTIGPAESLDRCIRRTETRSPLSRFEYIQLLLWYMVPVKLLHSSYKCMLICMSRRRHMALFSCIIELDRLISCPLFLVRVPAQRGRGHNSTKSLQHNYKSQLHDILLVYNLQSMPVKAKPKPFAMELRVAAHTLLRRSAQYIYISSVCARLISRPGQSAITKLLINKTLTFASSVVNLAKLSHNFFGDFAPPPPPPYDVPGHCYATELHSMA